MRRSLPLLAAVILAGCGGGERPAAPPATSLPRSAPSLGPGQRYRPPSLGARAARALPIGGLRCAKTHPRPIHGVHLELFAARRVVRVPAGIGVAPPRLRDGAYVRGGRCSYPLRTREPTGVVEVSAPGLTLGRLFAIWGQPLARTRMAGFRGTVRAYVGGRPWQRNACAIPLRRHAQIVLEVGDQVRPHSTYGFPPGL